ncbi:MAG TPA: helix-turn-helix domain-containing protein [Allosphingosinicella sp.]|jgi:transcriptional regulator with XRE-family HTH domain|nr:helix-turn-helix domain-containing protein [Allosphingosinicella sp.]
MSFSRLRIAAGFTLEEVSREFGVSPEAVRDWEEGRKPPPRHIARSLDTIGGYFPELTREEALAVRSGPALSPDPRPSPGGLIKSKQRVADHGEVFTPSWLVERMLDLVRGEAERIDSRVLEPACGSGNFLVPILKRKLKAVEAKYGRSAFDRGQYALLALSRCYGIEILADNIAECRANMLEAFAEYLGLGQGDDLHRAASHILSLNLIHGDAMEMKDSAGGPITVVEWSYLGKGKFNRRDFHLDVLTGSSGYAERWAAPGAEPERSLPGPARPGLDQRGRDPIFIPVGSHPPMTVRELAALDSQPAE